MQSNINPMENTTLKKLEIIFFFTLLIIIAALSLYIGAMWYKSKELAEFIGSKTNILPDISTVIQNGKLILNGYFNGYFRSFYGYFVFLVMSLCFIGTGGMFSSLIFIKRFFENPLAGSSMIERIAVYYIFGTALYSILWLILGLLGLLNISVAIFVAVMGLFSFFYIYRQKKIQTSLHLNKGSSLRIEVILLLLIFALAILFSTISVRTQTYSDVYQIHLPIPSMYIYDGKINPNPYTIYSYFPQNTEMLVMWSLLLKSEIASALLIWGFYLTILILTWKFFERHTDNFVASITTLIIATAPVVSWFSTAIKNDLPAAAFLLAHYLALVEAFNTREINIKKSAAWFVISGLFCGAAVGHKLTALIPATISFVVLVGYAAFTRLETKKLNFHIISVWSLGFAIFSLPWFLKSFLLTRNPIYPYFNSLFTDAYIRPWHGIAQVSSSFSSSGFQGLIHYFQLLLGVRKENGILGPPTWGSHFLLIVLFVFIFNRHNKLGFKLASIAAFLSFCVHIIYSFEARYHIGMLLFIICMSFAISFFRQIEGSKMQWKLKIIVLSIIGLSCLQSLVNSNMLTIARGSLSQLFSGFSPGNYNHSTTDQQINDLMWMSHIINTRTAKDDRILFAGVGYGYGIERNFFFGVHPDKQIIHDLAENSLSVLELVRHLQSLGVNHILLSSSFFHEFKNHIDPSVRIPEAELRKIFTLIQDHMTLRFAA